MKTITTQVGAFTTSDDVATDVLNLWRELAHRQLVEIVTIPVIDGETGARWVQLTIGHSLPLAVTDMDTHLHVSATDSARALRRSNDGLSNVPATPEDLPFLGWDEY